MRRFIFAILWGMALSAAAQKVTVKGVIHDSTGLKLPSATVMLMSPKDSTLVNFGVSNTQGVFEIRNVSRGEYLLKISFVGYGTLIRKFRTAESEPITDLGTLTMVSESQMLQEFTVVGDKAAVVVKKDTIEFNAGSFKTKANANVEDLLKKLPGVEVESDGTIRAQGEQVQRVTVDGREFFGRDPKLATRNLPADAVEKVQIFDKKSEQAAFTGIDDGSKEKTVNLELKEEKRNAAFGNIMAGAGTEDRRQAKANINRFSKGRQISFLGMANNINEQGFSIDDYMNFSGGAQQMMGGGGGGGISINVNSGGGASGTGGNSVPLNFGGRQNGIMTNYAGGLNFNQDYDKGRSKSGGNYFYNRLDQQIDRDLNRTNYLPADPALNLPARSYDFVQTSRQSTSGDNHRTNLTVDHFLDSANSLRFTAAASLAENSSDVTSEATTYSPAGDVTNTSDRRTTNTGTSTSFSGSLLWRHKFARKGRTFSSNFTFDRTRSDNDGTLLSENEFFGVNPRTQIIDQINRQRSENGVLGGTFSYTEPLGNRRYLEANYNHRISRNDVDREVFNQENGDLITDAQLSNAYTSEYTYSRPGLNLRINREKYNVTVGAGYQNTRLQGDLITRNVTIDRTFRNLLPVARFNYDFTTFKRFRFDYEASMREPTLQQLQPVVENSDPINIYVGNPELKPSYVHTGSANFTWFDPSKSMNFFTFLNSTYQTKAIINAQSVNENLVRTTTPVNVKDQLSVNANMNLGFPIKKLLSRINVGPSGNYLRTQNILNERESSIIQQTLGGNVRYNLTYKDILTLDLSANVRAQQTRYDANPELDQNFLNKTYSAETSLSFLKHYQLTANYDYFVYESVTTGFRQTIPVMNIWLSRFVLKGNSGELKAGVSNLFDRSLSVTQSATANYLQQERLNNLGRYFMVSFTYALNKQLNPFGGGGGGGGRRGGGMMRMMIRQD